jgi:hypothetical protein
MAVAAVLCIGMAEVLAGEYRFYEFGVEEMLACGSAALLGFAAWLSWLAIAGHSNSPAPQVIGLLAAAGGAFGVYRRFGYVYAAAASIVLLVAIPFQFNLSASIHRVAAAAILAMALMVVRSKRLRYQDEWPGDEYGQLQAVVLAGLYVALNVKIGWENVGRGFYWFTYGMTFVLPIVGLVFGIREKDRPLLNISILMAIVTLVTNKSYLGWMRYEWDPILLGVALMVVAVGLRRWLSNGPQGQRNGFTVTPVVTDQKALLAVLSAVPFGMTGHAPSSSAGSQPGFDGGRSGGGGGDAKF